MTAFAIVLHEYATPETPATRCSVCRGTFYADEHVVMLCDAPAHAGCTFTCGDCERVMADYEQHDVWAYGVAYSYCAECFEDHTWRCSNCDDHVHESIAPRDWGSDCDAVCRSCLDYLDERDREEQEAARRVIGCYHDHARRSVTAPVPSDWTLRHGGRYFGVELEVERTTGADDADALAAALLEAGNGLATGAARKLFAEHDGSLTDGFELITQPMGLDTHATLWAHVLGTDAARMLRSHDTQTCGLHVHVSRTGLTRLQIAKAVVFLNDSRNENFIRAIARRYDTHYCCRKSKSLGRAARSDDRYEMLNLTNSRTVEFRLFRGTMRHETLMACVEFAHAVLEFSRHASCADLTMRPFLQHVYAPANRADTLYLRRYLARRVTTRMAPRYVELRAAITDITGKAPVAPATSPDTAPWAEV